MKEDGLVDKAFQQVKKEYFPEWDTSNEWSTVVRDHIYSDGYQLGAMGQCVLNMKQILIDKLALSLGSQHLVFLLIHEISHDARRPQDKRLDHIPGLDFAHGHRWQERMAQAMKRAEELGNNEVARLILIDLKKWSANRTVPASVMYARIDCETSDHEYLEYDEIIDECRRHVGLSLEAFHRRYRKTVEAYNGAKQGTIDRSREVGIPEDYITDLEKQLVGE